MATVVVGLGLNFGCQTAPKSIERVPEAVTAVVLVAEDAGPTLRISPSAIRNELGRITAERQRREAMTTVLPKLRLVLSSSFLAEQMRSEVEQLSPARFPFRVQFDIGPAAMESEGEESGGQNDVDRASGQDRLYLTLASLGLATGATAETPLRAFVEVRVQLRLEDGTLAWDDTVRVDERVEARGRGTDLDVTARSRAVDLLNLKSDQIRAIFSRLSRNAMVETAARLRRATRRSRATTSTKGSPADSASRSN